MPTERTNNNAVNQGPVPYDTARHPRPRTAAKSTNTEGARFHRRQAEIEAAAEDLMRPYRTDRRGCIHLTNQKEFDIIIPHIPDRLTTEECDAIHAEGEASRRETIKINRKHEREEKRAAKEAARLAGIAERLRKEVEAREEAEKAKKARIAHKDYMTYGEGRFSPEEQLQRVANVAKVHTWDQSIRDTLPHWIDWRDITCNADQWFSCNNEWPLMEQSMWIFQQVFKTAKAHHDTCDPVAYAKCDELFEDLENTLYSWKRCCLTSQTTNGERRRFLRDLKKVVFGVIRQHDIEMEIELIIQKMAAQPIAFPRVYSWEFTDVN
ncbi:hypothetical protein WOLCODRAFT_19975 [Wolfiporia cocos MD-104 SS10]|uniref:Uncharacterized protein n=1 Tax=Wolfiporia cocos (strain MD-104) TaxID=742152 RepID=A0A2H3J6P7_WOLCO|nr:hypothetical protein WOLCODRAFT_19975 [Wolfiporia cocos MD-104 SS10]